jgi:hypothetical protein
MIVIGIGINLARLKSSLKEQYASKWLRITKRLEQQYPDYNTGLAPML